MKIKTKYFDEIDVDEKDMITFENGIPGFWEETRFVILPFTDDGLFEIMQSVATPELAFVITDPFFFFKDYAFDLDDGVAEQLGIVRPEDVKVSVILTIREPFENTTANLQAPVVINRKNRKAKQVVLNNVPYTTKHPLFPKKGADAGRGVK